MPTFLENFRYTDDLIYGLTKQRDVYLDRWLVDMSAEEDEEAGATPQERKQYWAKATQKSKMFINAYNQPIINTNFSAPVLSIPKSPDIEVTKYQARLQSNPKFAPGSVRTASMRSLSKGDASTANLDKAGLSLEKLADLEGLLATRRACKFGLEQVTLSPKHPTVHYVLDGIVMTEVVAKATHPLYSGDVGVPITTSELRFLFRNWGRFRDLNKIRFYHAYVECPPPWEAGNLDLWAQYAMELMKKPKYGASPTQLNAASSWSSVGNFKGIIGVFHNMAKA